ncbi:MAG: glycoside hydrolase family 38 C-terminal domain-containing protein [Candidatus Omnitrophota bacterium]
MEKITTWESEIKKLENSLKNFCGLGDFKFKQNVTGAEDPAFDDRDWEIKKEPRWSLKNGPAYFRKVLRFPKTVEGIPLSGSMAELSFVFPSGVEIFWDGKSLYQNKFWADMIAAELPLPDKITPGKTHVLVFKTPGGDGLGVFGGYFSLPSVEKALFELTTALYQIRFAEKLLKKSPGLSLEKSFQRAVSLIALDVIQKRRWPEIFANLKEIENVLEPFRSLARKYRVHLIGHSHIDMNWLWNYPDTINTCLRDFDTVTKLMDEYPDLTFSQDQTHIYRIVEEHNPKLFARVKEKIKEGRWEVTANAWTEGDLNMADGEALCRHITYSRKYVGEHFGVKPEIMWCPDTFGHPVTIPAILSHAGITNYFFTRAGGGYPSGEFAFPLFTWQSPNGNKVLAFNSAYSNCINPENAISCALKFQKKYNLFESMFVYGVGDHGGGPTRKDIERKKRMDRKPVMPNLVFSTTHRFFDLVRNKKNYPVVKKELNSIFEGCYTTHSDIKQENRECENSLLTLETIVALAGLLGKEYPAKKLESWWQDTLFNQFHDIFDGSAISESYQYSKGLADKVIAGNKALLAENLTFISKQVNTTKEGIPLVVFNSLGWKRSGVVEFELPEGTAGKELHVIDGKGKQMPVQAAGKKSALFLAESIPSFGYKTYWLKIGSCNPAPPPAPLPTGEREKEGMFETSHYRIEIAPDSGVIRRLYDKKNEREVLSVGRSVGEDRSSYWAETCGNLLQVLQEKPHGMSAWIIGNIARIENLLDLEEFKVVESGPVRTTLSIKRRYRESMIEQKITLYAALPWIDFEVIADWQEKGSDKDGVPMLRVNFQADFDRPLAEFEIPFGWQERRTEGKELPALKAVSLAEKGYRLGLLNREKHGYLVNGKNLGLTLLRNPYEPDSLPDSGTHCIGYRLIFGKISKAEMSRQAASYNRLLSVCLTDNHGGKLPPELSLLDFRSGDCVPSSLQKSLDGKNLTLRFYNVSDKKTTTELKFGFSPKGLFRTGLPEEKGDPISIRKNKALVPAKPRSLNTLKIKI